MALAMRADIEPSGLSTVIRIDVGTAQQRDAETTRHGTDGGATAGIALLGRGGWPRAGWALLRLLRLGRWRQVGRDAGGPQFAQRGRRPSR